MSKLQRTSPIAVLAFALAGGVAGLFTQLWFSSMGKPTLVPPLSLALTLVLLAGVLLWLAIALRRATQKTGPGHVNPFHAVRLLAAAKASQFSGALIGGFALGLLAQVFTRTVLPPPATWAPMLATFVAAIVLVVCAIVSEALCMVPPGDSDDQESGQHPSPHTDPSPSPQTAQNASLEP